MKRSSFDVVIVGAGHNGLVAATLLAGAGCSVVVLERGEAVGGAAVSGTPFPGVDARVSRYAYLVSLFPRNLLRLLGVDVELRGRAVASYTPAGSGGLLIGSDRDQAREALGGEFEAWERLQAMLAGVAQRLFPTLTEPLRSREEIRELLDDAAWTSLFEQPLSELLEHTFTSDLVRGIVLTDATIGTFAPAGDSELRQNRCFLYHVIGNGTGRWDVPVGGMGAVTGALQSAALRAGAQINTRSEIVSVTCDGAGATVECVDGRRYQCRHVVSGVAPAVLSRLLGETPVGPVPEGSQLKINMVLLRLPALRDRAVSPSQAFAGTFHVNEGFEQIELAFREASSGSIPSLPPCELYCHTLTDPSILSAPLRRAGAQTLTLFGLHMPARLFAAGDTEAKERAVRATLRSVDSVLAEPLEDCLWRGSDGRPCIEARTPTELESELGLPGGHIFHRDLAWPFAETDEEVGSWGVETDHPNVWICGAGARRGGGVSGIPGHNAARAVLDALRTR